MGRCASIRRIAAEHVRRLRRGDATASPAVALGLDHAVRMVMATGEPHASLLAASGPARVQGQERCRELKVLDALMEAVLAPDLCGLPLKGLPEAALRLHALAFMALRCAFAGNGARPRRVSARPLQRYSPRLHGPAL